MSNDIVFPENALEMVQSCAPDEVCWALGDKFLKTTKERLTAALEAAFRQAWVAAEANAEGHLGEIESFHMDDPQMGATFLRIVLRDSMGREASGIGFIPNPNREH